MTMLRVMRRFLVIPLAAAFLAVAGGGADAQQSGGEAEATLLETPFLTLRNHTGSKAPKSYYGEGRSTRKAGICKVSQTELSFLSSAAEVAPFRIPEEILRVSGLTEMPEDMLWDRFVTRVGAANPILYVHGYYVDFEKGCRRATVFQKNTGLEGQLLLFSWPSDGSLINYASDEVDLYWSVPDIAATILEMRDRFPGRKLNLVGHSLGSRGLFLALYDLSSRHADLDIGHVVLLAPDIDFGIFEKLLPRVRGLADSITVYTAASDRPLALSRQVHGYPRLGESGNDVEALAGVEVIDVSDLPVMSATGHLYHVYNPDVGSDLNQLLTEDRLAGERKNLVKAGRNLWRLQKDGAE